MEIKDHVIFVLEIHKIKKKYTNSNRDVEISEVAKEEVITKLLRVVNLAENGVNIPFYNIIEMKNILFNDKNALK